ncbi:probable Bax inhibitor 1 [Oppia nitens]|uniref:probable Bax inhibitor 1 n=1 Tax=Oppia nitens TaxID=1686743 RepID=UPI0023D9F554|nr:probable Bax inhibitor 1 [Oppia nitens]
MERIDSFFSSLNRKIEPQVQTHLKDVYSSMSIALLSAAIGGYVHLFTNILQGGLLSTLVAMGFVIALYSTPDNGKNRSTRLWYLIGFAFASGLGLGPLMEYAIIVNPTLIPTAFLSTCVIFGCFSLSAMFSDQRRWLYLGGTLMSFLSLLLMMSIINLFIGSKLLYQIHLYLAFFVVCGFIMFDTTLIIEKRRHGDTDYIAHSVMLFIDFVDVFRYLLIILTQKEERKQRKNK